MPAGPGGPCGPTGPGGPCGPTELATTQVPTPDGPTYQIISSPLSESHHSCDGIGNGGGSGDTVTKAAMSPSATCCHELPFHTQALPSSSVIQISPFWLPVSGSLAKSITLPLT